MRLPEFALLAVATISAISAGWGAAMLALPQPKFRIIRVLFWIGALTFGSLGIVWSATSPQQPLWVQMLVSALIGGIAAAAIAWGLWEIRSQEAKKEPAIFPAKSAIFERATRSTLEATNKSIIDATGATIPGDLPFQFGRADSESIISMPGITVTREDGQITIRPGSHTNVSFPPPTGEFTSLSNDELKILSPIVSQGVV